MTPKEKAKELIEQFIKPTTDTHGKSWVSKRKQCALICVNEIIEKETHPSDYDKHNQKVVGSRITDVGKYWQEVKLEIQKL